MQENPDYPTNGGAKYMGLFMRQNNNENKALTISTALCSQIVRVIKD